ncbi:type II toxin-antitoxin system VapC family toxin [Demequina sp. SYSU T00192]|uniref:Ribonuclease VapC n=1 Tax=Demequina litoralis TaxID=3051660 RepID=A0ABT8G602_9MICO|nr:type II toxin-antitoxin system VapC family toxin [Demequina sp. SYSU T00192]MDN4474442.1 type II toxin-antitoxin system VapC family toxin [Demequina sp. SYSU T00192]
MTYLVDTNVISELRKKHDAVDARVFAWADSVALELLHTSAMCLFELERGVLQRERKDPRQGAVLRAWLDTRVRTAFAGRILAVSDEVATYAARLHVPNPRPYVDTLIAATAATHGLTLVTRNIADFEELGVDLLNPWAAR